ncbi:hypothetical protein ACH4C2_36640 [Streptomyces sp. NPDC018057]|uniref:hypothetical protein n=1 Tax=unclassified Streptomyces TaxID=2593676 RepID=UPI0037A0E975
MTTSLAFDGKLFLDIRGARVATAHHIYMPSGRFWDWALGDRVGIGLSARRFAVWCGRATGECREGRFV